MRRVREGLKRKSRQLLSTFTGGPQGKGRPSLFVVSSSTDSLGGPRDPSGRPYGVWVEGWVLPVS